MLDAHKHGMQVETNEQRLGHDMADIKPMPTLETHKMMAHDQSHDEKSCHGAGSHSGHDSKDCENHCMTCANHCSSSGIISAATEVQRAVQLLIGIRPGNTLIRSNLIYRPPINA